MLPIGSVGMIMALRPKPPPTRAEPRADLQALSTATRGARLSIRCASHPGFLVRSGERWSARPGRAGLGTRHGCSLLRAERAAQDAISFRYACFQQPGELLGGHRPA